MAYYVTSCFKLGIESIDMNLKSRQNVDATEINGSFEDKVS